MKNKYIIVIAIAAMFSAVTNAQTLTSSVNSKPKVNALTADSLASGNYKDVFTSFFQLAFKDLTGPQKSLNFASNPFAIMARGNPDLLTDTSYVKYRHLRDLNFNIGLLIDSAYRLNGFSCGVKYALINSRDETVSKDFINQATHENDDFDKLTRLFGGIISNSTIYSRDFRVKFSNQVHKWQNDTSFKYSSLDQDVRLVIDTLIKQNSLTELQGMIQTNPNFSFNAANQKSYQDLKSEWQNKPLWTASALSTFKPGASSVMPSNYLVASNVSLISEFLVGLNSAKNRMKLEVDLIAVDSFSNDNTLSGQNLKRNVFTFEPGLNFVWKSKDDKPFMEFKIGGSYSHIFSKPHAQENIDSSTINGTFRLRLINDIWAPVTFKMDKNGHVFATLDLKMNFTSFTKLFNKKS